MKRIKAIVADLERQGAIIIRTTKGYQIRCPQGGIVVMHCTPSDHRAERNLRAELRKRGMEWPFD